MMNLKQRLAGLVLLALLGPVALLGLLATLLLVLCGPIDKARSALRGMDMFGNASVFAGSYWETISSHAGREAAAGARWAVWLSRALDVLQRGHCAAANAQEQPLLNAIECWRGN